MAIFFLHQESFYDFLGQQPKSKKLRVGMPAEPESINQSNVVCRRLSAVGSD